MLFLDQLPVANVLHRARYTEDGKANAVVKKKEAVRRGGTQREDSGEVLRFSRSIPKQSPWHATRVHQYRVWKDLHLALGKTLTGWQ